MSEQRKISWVKIAALCCMVYFTSYMTRYNYAAVLSEIEASEGVGRTFAGMAVTLAFITYGLGQVVSGYIGDKVVPKYLIAIGMVATGICNFAVGLCGDMYVTVCIWALNGFAQAFLWPPLVKFMTQTLNSEQYGKTNAMVVTASSIATVLIYILVAPLCIEISGWRLTFFVCGTWALVATVLWLCGTRGLANEKVANKPAEVKQDSGKKSGALRLILELGVIPLMIIIVMQGILRDGITTWLPTYITDTFKLSTSSSILTSGILPIFAIISVWVTQWLRGKCSSEVSTTIVLWIVSIVCAVGLLFLHKSQMLISVVLMSTMTACAHGINLMLICNIPIRFVKYGNVSFFSGIINACTYVGSALSSYGIALVSEKAGWNTTIIIWGAVAVIGFVLTLYSIKRSKLLRDE